MPTKQLLATALAWLLTIAASRLQAGYIDNINGSATPASHNGLDDQVQPGDDLGWYYTPAFSYSLDGIFTNFGPFAGQHTTPLITIQIQSERPVNGGAVLRQGSFQGDSIGGIEGANFAPISLIAGDTYFVDIKGLNGMGVNVGTWQTVNGNPEPSGGATVNLGSVYYDDATSTGFPFVLSGGAYGVSSSGFNVAGGEPILFFSGTVPTPEPSSVVMMAGGLLAFVGWTRRRSLDRK